MWPWPTVMTCLAPRDAKSQRETEMGNDRHHSGPVSVGLAEATNLVLHQVHRQDRPCRHREAHHQHPRAVGVAAYIG